MMARTTKTCPDCAEEVLIAARKCRFCAFIFPRSQDAESSLPAALPSTESASAVQKEPTHAQDGEPALRWLGPTQARLILGLLIVLAVCISYFYFVYVLGLSIFLVLLYGALVMQERQNNPRAVQDAKILCAHCHSVGCVTTAIVTLKKGISGGKATEAILTGGWSLLAVGLSRKEKATEAKCSNCGSVWHF